MGQIGEEEKVWEIPVPEKVPDTVPADLPVREPEKVPA